MKRIRWNKYSGQFHQMADELVSNPDISGYELRLKIFSLHPSASSENNLFGGVNPFLLAFLEFLFACAEGPYHPSFSEYSLLIKRVLSSSPELRDLLNYSAADALGNMILDGRGRLKFVISDNLELQSVLDSWEKFGLDHVSSEQVFLALMQKNTVQRKFKEGDPVLMIRLIDVFPDRKELILPGDMDPDVLRENAQVVSGSVPSQSRYKRLTDRMLNSGLNLDELIMREEKRILPLNMNRNPYLSYLIKRKEGNICNICSLTGIPENPGPLTVHHIKPLSDGGKDIAINMIAVCRFHHDAIHAGKISISGLEKNNNL